MPLRGLFYHYSPGRDIGHAVRIFRLAESLKRRAGRAIELSLFRDADALFPPPAAWKYGPFVPLPSPLPAHRSKRRAILLSSLRGGRPDFIVTAFFPFGRTGCAAELLPILKEAKRSGVKLYSAVPVPYFSHSEKDLGSLYYFADFYDRIFIHSPLVPDLKCMAKAVPFERRITSGRFLEVFETLKSKLLFTGPVLPPPLRTARRRGRFILIHRGGGSNSPDIVTCAILGKRYLKSRLPMMIVSGPASSAAEMRFWRGLIRRNRAAGVSLMRATDDLFGLLARAAVLAGTAGSTVYEALYLNKKAVLVPYTGSPGAERSDQLGRAAMLHALVGATVLDYKELSPGTLAKALDEAIDGPEPAFKVSPGSFGGAAVFAETILQDLGATRVRKNSA